MIEGQKVICVNDVFPDWAKAMYNELPEKDKQYTIRKVCMGCSPTHVNKKSKGGVPEFIGNHEVTLLLVELNNPIHQISKQEMGFISDRFIPLETNEDEVIKQEEKPIVIKQPKQKPVLV